jgi:spermidine synthase
LRSPDGVLQQWWPSGERKIVRAVARSIRQSFPYVRCYKGLGNFGVHFIASRQPLRPINVQRIVDTMPAKVKQDFLEWNPGYALKPLVDPVVAVEIPIERIANDESKDKITDDRPFNEYYFVRRAIDKRKGAYYFVQ